MFLQFSLHVMRVEGSCREPEAIIREGIARLESFYRELGLPTSMEELGIRPEDFPLMAEQAISVRGPIGGLERLDAEDVRNIYRLPQWRELIALFPNTQEKGKSSSSFNGTALFFAGW